MKHPWWLGTTLLETSILFVIHFWLTAHFKALGRIRYVYLSISALQVLLRGIGYRGTFEMTSDWFSSKKNTNMGLAYAFYLPQIFLMALHLNYQNNIPYFADSTYSKIIMDNIFLSFCMNVMTLILIGFSRAAFRSNKSCVCLLALLWFILTKNLYINHYSNYCACIFFVFTIFHLSSYFYDCFSFGEYSTICQAFVLSLLILLQKYYWKLFPTKKQFTLELDTRILLASTISCSAAIVIYSLLHRFAQKVSRHKRVFFEIVSFFLCLSLLFLTMQLALEVSSPLGVIACFFDYISSKTPIFLILWWFFVSFLTAFYVIGVAWHPDCFSSVALSRKGFHLSVVACYVPGLLVDVQFLVIASSGVLWLFCILECVRLSRFTAIGEKISLYFVPFLKKSCSKWFIIPNHFILLLAVSLPAWINNFIYFGDMKRLLAAHQINFLFSGVVSVGIGDALASCVGVFFGKHKIADGRKSYEGILASFVSQLLFYTVMFRLISRTFLPTFFDLIYIICSLTSAVLEGLTLQEDNIILPIITISQMIAFLPRNVALD